MPGKPVLNELVHIYSVTELTKNIRELLENKFPEIWVRGEIFEFKHHSSGHMYFRLKDEKSLLKVAMFKGKNMHLKFVPKEGLKVTVFGRISVYDTKGEYQLIADYLEPAGLGSLMLAFEELKKKLQKEGLFDDAFKSKIPEFPQKIGIITSPTGAAIRDILNIINRRFANVHIVIYPVRVQGDGAAKEISNAIREMNKMSGFDVLIVGRGGGSIEDLWAFNEEIVARAIFSSEIPVISAVGHEVDWTIADYVADLRAPTPSAAAELVVKNKEEVISKIESYKTRVDNAFLNLLENAKEKLLWMEKSVEKSKPDAKIRQIRQDLDSFLGRIEVKIKHIMELNKKNIKVIAGKLNALSPLAVLERGYSVAFKIPDKKIIKDSGDVGIGDKINVKLSKGNLTCNVEDKQI